MKPPAPAPVSAGAPEGAWLAGRRGPWAAAAWAAAEASFFFLVPDILLSWVALRAPRRLLVHLLWAVAAAVLAGLAMFQWAAASPQARAFVAAVPRVSAAMFEQADADFARHGALGAALGPARGIPYKVYAVQAPAQGIALAPFALASLPARAWRMAATAVVFALLGALLRRFGKAHWGAPLHAAFWIVSVTAYWLTIG